MLASFLDMPPEILQKIVLFAVADSPLVPPRELCRLSSTCHALHNLVSIYAPDLYAGVFAEQFDIKAPLDRIGSIQLQSNAKIEMKRRFNALHCFKTADVDNPLVTEAFWVAYLMLEDSGSSNQKNLRHLHRAGLPAFLDRFLRHRLHEGSPDNNGWPLLDEKNSLAIALSWLLSSQFSVRRETPQSRREMLELLNPFVFAAFRYPITNVPEHCFDIDEPDQLYKKGSTLHGPYPPLSLPPRDVAYFGEVIQKISIPSAPLFAILLYFARVETITPMVPSHLTAPKQGYTRSAASSNRCGPTLEDVDHFIRKCQTHFVKFPTLDANAFDIQGTGALNPALMPGQPMSYKLGTLTGRWQGSCIMPCIASYTSWLHNLSVPPRYEITGRQPLYVTLQEHYTSDPLGVVPRDGLEHGSANAWLPTDCQWVEHQDGIEIFDRRGTFKKFYQTFRQGRGLNPGHENPVDVIITGKTDGRQAAAWGGYKVLGRVRLSDGLVVLSRESLAGLGTSLLRGCVTSSQNLVGRIGGVSTGFAPANWEAVFSLCKDNAAGRI